MSSNETAVFRGAATNNAIGTVFEYTLLPFYIIASALFLYRRNVYPIKGRLPSIIIITNIGFFFGTLSQCFSLTWQPYTEAECVIGKSFLNLGILACILCFIIRSWVLFFSHSLTHELITHHSQAKRNSAMVAATQKSKVAAKSPSSAQPAVSPSKEQMLKNDIEKAKASAPAKQSNWYHNHRYMIEPKFLLLCALAILVVLDTYPLVLIFTACNEEIDFINTVFVGIIIIGAMPLVFAARKLHNLVDGFFIKEELALSGKITIVCMLAASYFIAVGADSLPDGVQVDDLIIALLQAAVVSVTTIWPLYRSYVNPPSPVKEIPKNIASFKEVIEDPQGFESFKDFLAKEFAVENLLFWRDVESFHKLVESMHVANQRVADEKQVEESSPEANSVLIMQCLNELYDKYIEQDATLMVNLPFDIKNKIVAGMKAIRDKSAGGLTKEDMELMDPAHRNIFNLMEGDNWLRYKKSVQYAQLCREYKKIAETQKEMAALNLI